MRSRLADTRRPAGCGGCSWSFRNPGKTVPGAGPAGDARAVSLHVGAAQSPGESGPGGEGLLLAMVPGAGWEQGQDQVKVERNQGQNHNKDQVKL